MEQALALYATLKAQSRTDASVRDTVASMAPLANTRKTPHQRKEQRIKAKAKKVADLNASLAKEGVSSATPEPVAPTTAPVATVPAIPTTTAAPVST